MPDNNGSLAEQIRGFQPTKTLWFWSCAGVTAAAIFAGFSFGGWVTAGTAQEMVESATKEARAELVASVCVERFVNGEDFGARLTQLKETRSWKRDDMIEEGKWAMIAGLDKPVAGAASLCAARLAEMEAPQEPMAEDASPAAEAGETTG